MHRFSQDMMRQLVCLVNAAVNVIVCHLASNAEDAVSSPRVGIQAVQIRVWN